MSHHPVVVIGVGNPYRRDDGVGPAVIARLAELGVPDGVHLVDLDGEPVRLMQAWEGASEVWVVDAVRSGAPAGTLHTVDALVADLPVDRGTGVAGGHALGVGEAVRLARALDRLPGRLTVLGVEGACFDDGAGLSPEVAVTADALARSLIGVLRHAGSASADSRNPRAR